MSWVFKLWALLPLATCIALHSKSHFGSVLSWRKPRVPYLLAFHDESLFSKTMEPVVREVSKETGLHIEVFNVNNKKGSKVYSKISLLCNTNSVPLYYNLKSGYSIVGVTTHENLRNWALGQNPSKIANVRMEELEEAAYRVTGFKRIIIRGIGVEYRESSDRLKGEEKMIKRYGISDQQ